MATEKKAKTTRGDRSHPWPPPHSSPQPSPSPKELRQGRSGCHGVENVDAEHHAHCSVGMLHVLRALLHLRGRRCRELCSAMAAKIQRYRHVILALLSPQWRTHLRPMLQHLPHASPWRQSHREQHQHQRPAHSLLPTSRVRNKTQSTTEVVGDCPKGAGAGAAPCPGTPHAFPLQGLNQQGRHTAKRAKMSKEEQRIAATSKHSGNHCHTKMIAF